MGDNTLTGKSDNRPLTTAAIFGEIITLLMNSEDYKYKYLSEMEWLVIPPLQLKQFHLAIDQSKQGTFPSTSGVAFWAFVSKEVDERLSSAPNAPVRLQFDEWKSGDIPWLIDTIGIPEVKKKLLQGLTQSVFKNTAFKIRVQEADGYIIKTVNPS